MNKTIPNLLLGISIIVLASVIRFYHLPRSPFWVDEFSTAHQAELLLRYGVGIFKQNTYFFEFSKIIPSLLVAISFKLFGTTELAARLPFLLIGSFVPFCAYQLFKNTLGRLPAILGSLFAVFSYTMITWSQQARGYTLIQLLVLCLFISYFSMISGKKYGLVFFVIISIIGTLSHPLFAIALASVLIHSFVFNRGKFRINIFLLCITSLVLILAYCNNPNTSSGTIFRSIFNQNFYINIAYYHSYLWRIQTLVTFLGMVGLLVCFLRTSKNISLFIIYLFSHLLFICFNFESYVTRYLLPILPFLFGGMGFIIYEATRAIGRLSHTRTMIASMMISMIIIGNGDTFTLKPKPFYNVNHEFREIALIDYPQIYNIIKQKRDESTEAVTIIDTWPERAYWYLGELNSNTMLFRWEDAGSMKKTPYTTDAKGIKYVIGKKSLRLISSLKDLNSVFGKSKKGFLLIDDTTLPYEVRNYADKFLKKEISLDHYFLDDNPYSVWPVTLYSWDRSNDKYVDK